MLHTCGKIKDSSNMKLKIPYIFFLLVAFTVPAYGQTEVRFQDQARPFGLDVVAPVMRGGSDDASAEFKSDQLPNLINFVDANLNERQALSDIAGVSLDPEALVLQNEASVRVYFVSEGAGYRNTLGYTVENLATGSTSDQLLIFPDASSTFKVGQGLASLNRVSYSNNAPLVPGDFVDLGVYGANSQMDFFLIANGANGGTNVYTADTLSNPDQIQHVVAFAVPDSPYLLIGFEDLYGGGDMDYNDILFAVDIGERNVAALANPEPGVILMMLLLGGAGFFVYRKQNKLESSTAA